MQEASDIKMKRTDSISWC